MQKYLWIIVFTLTLIACQSFRSGRKPQTAGFGGYCPNCVMKDMDTDIAKLKRSILIKKQGIDFSAEVNKKIDMAVKAAKCAETIREKVKLAPVNEAIETINKYLTPRCKKAYTSLRKLSKDKSEFVRASAAFAAGIVGASTGTMLLKKLSKDASFKVRYAVAEALEAKNIHKEVRLELLSKLAKDREDEIRWQILQLAASLEGSEKRQLIKEFLNDSHDSIRNKARQLLSLKQSKNL